MRSIEEAFDGSVAEQGWDPGSQIRVLREFIESEADLDGLVRARFQAYLDERVDAEIAAGLFDPDEEDPAPPGAAWPEAAGG